MVFVNNIALPLASLDCKMWEIGKDIYSVCQSPQATFTTPKLAYGVVKLAYGDGVSETCHQNFDAGWVRRKDHGEKPSFIPTPLVSIL